MFDSAGIVFSETFNFTLIDFLGEGSFCDTCGQFHPNVHRLKKHHDAHHRQIKCKTCGK